jgi:ketosteroid isomerase-like protein
MPTTKPGAAAEHLLFDALDALKMGDVQPWVNMFQDDGVMEFPYAPAGGHTRLDGKAAIAEYLKPYPERISIKRVIRRAVYHCGDVMVAEFACESTAVPTGNQFEMNYVAIVTVKNGKIKHYRDYWNPLVAIQAFGGLEALTKQVTAEPKT